MAGPPLVGRDEELSRAQELAGEVAERAAVAGVWSFEQFALLGPARLGAPHAAAAGLQGPHVSMARA